MTAPSLSGTLLDLRQHAFRVRRRGVEYERPLRFRARAAPVAGLEIGLGEVHVRGRLVFAPDRNLERIDRIRGPAGAQMNAADQQVRARFVRRQIDGAPELGERFAILLAFEEAPALLEMERRELALLALRGREDRLLGAKRERAFGLQAHALEPRRHGRSRFRRAAIEILIPRRELAR